MTLFIEQYKTPNKMLHQTAIPLRSIAAGELSDNWEALEPDDEVLATALTCTATNWPIINSGLNLKWVDVDPLTLN